MSPDKLLWLDLEMTGLVPASDLIVETACVITDFRLQSLASYQSPGQATAGKTGQVVR